MLSYLRIVAFCAITALLGTDIFIQKVNGLAESTGPDGSNAKAVHALGETGEGINVGLISADNTRVTHEAFKNAQGDPNAFAYDFTGNGIQYSNHDTWVAGVVASRGGAAYPNDLGIAPGANIHSARVVDNSHSISSTYFTAALDYLISVKNCRVIVTGIQLYDSILAIPNGNSIWTKIYDYYAYNYDVVFANAAGNFIYDPCGILITDRVTIFGDAYNGITTGGLRTTDPDVYGRIGSKSCEGPTQDGRNKPELAGPVQNQTVPSGGSDTSWFVWTSAGGETSFSAPHAAGVAALLLGLVDEIGNPDAGHAEVIRAVIVNSTFPNINDRNNNPTTGQTYHDHRGYGRIDALRAYETLQADRVFKDTDIGEQKGWAFENLGKNKSHTYTIYGEQDDRLIITLTWDRYVSSSYVAENPILNLDMEIIDPNNDTVFGENDTQNNLVKCDIITNATGYHQIEITNTSASKNRDYGLAFEVLPPIAGDLDINYVVDSADLYLFASQWLRTGADLEADLFLDESIDMRDFAVFAQNWLIIDPAYYGQ
ncbi:MAG: S8 family serine peptidase [Planctomycetota bacterium]